MMEGCRHDDSRVPPLYCDPKQFGQNMLVLDWLLEKANSDLTDDIEFRLYSLPALLFYMVKVATSEVNSSASRSRTSSRITEVNKVPSVSIAEAHLNRQGVNILPQCQVSLLKTSKSNIEKYRQEPTNHKHIGT